MKNRKLIKEFKMFKQRWDAGLDKEGDAKILNNVIELLEKLIEEREILGEQVAIMADANNDIHIDKKQSEEILKNIMDSYDMQLFSLRNNYICDASKYGERCNDPMVPDEEKTFFQEEDWYWLVSNEMVEDYDLEDEPFEIPELEHYDGVIRLTKEQWDYLKGKK